MSTFYAKCKERKIRGIKKAVICIKKLVCVYIYLFELSKTGWVLRPPHPVFSHVCNPFQVNHLPFILFSCEIDSGKDSNHCPQAQRRWQSSGFHLSQIPILLIKTHTLTCLMLYEDPSS